jgi:hypothetical protein
VTNVFRCPAWIVVVLVLGALPTPAVGQESAFDSMRTAITRLTTRLDSLESGSCPDGELEVIAPSPGADPALDSLRGSLSRLADRVSQLARARCTERVEPAPSGQVPAQPVSAPGRTAGAYMNIGFDGLVDAGWSSEQDVGTLQLGDHDPAVRGFTIPNVELTLDGAVDPYFKGFANIVYKLDPGGETGVELEEAYILTTSLPGNLQLRGGQFFAEFGRQNQQHPHSWSFVDQPLILNRMFGPDGLRSQGARLSWLPPTSWYTEAMISVLNSAGGTAFSFRSDESSEIHGGVADETGVRRLDDFLVVPRIAASFELTGTQTLLFGASGAFGPNSSGPGARTSIYGVDVFWKWKSATAAQGFPFVSLQAEALIRKYDAASRPSADDALVTLPSENLTDRGVYAQMLWGVKPRLVLGLRGEAATGDAAAFTADLRTLRYRLSPNVTWYPSEFSKIRLQYNYDNRETVGDDHSLWLQFEFIMGAHAAHKF